MNIIAHEDGVCRRDDGHVSGRKFPLIIDQTLRHYQSNQKRENTRERFRRFEVYKAKIGIFQQGKDDWRLRRKGDEYDIDLAVVQCLNRAFCSKR